MVVVYTNGRQDTEENLLLGMDFTDKDRYTSSDFLFPSPETGSGSRRWRETPGPYPDDGISLSLSLSLCKTGA